MTARRVRPSRHKPRRVNLDERGEDFERLLGTAAEIMRAEIGVELDEEKREALRSSARYAISWHGVLEESKDDARAVEVPLHGLKTPLIATIKALRRPIVEDAISFTLGKGDLPPGRCNIERGAERLGALIDVLEEIAASLPPYKKKSGNPGNQDLYQLVHTLANDWIGITGHHFAQSSKDGASATNAATQFVYAVVDFVDPGARKAVPKMIERVVSERKQGRVMPWLNLGSVN